MAVFSQGMNANATCTESIGADPGDRAAVFHQPPWSLAVHRTALERGTLAGQRPKQCAFDVACDSRNFDVRKDRPRGIRQEFARLLVPLLREMQVMLDSVKFQMPNARPN
jgi:hypothetical protein